MSGQAEGVGLRERYVLGDRIAVGGMGAVFRAHDTERDEMVALKLMHEHLVQGASRWRFQREARVAASLWHPHIVRVRDHGRRIVDGMDQLYLVMDLIEGTTVRRMVRRKGVVPLGVFYALVCQLLDALAYVHARDVLHRDIKPSNLLVERGEDGALVLEVVDFGLATELGPDASRLTGGDQVLGTPAYMAPEQASGDELIGPAADLYAVGVLLFQALTGSPPFTGPAATVLVQKLRVSAPLERLPSTTPSALRELVAELLDRDPARRPRSAASVLERLRPHATTARLDIDTWNRLRPPAFQREDAATVVEQRRRHEPGHALTPAPEIWGREAERARFEQAAREVEEGEPRVVLVEGEVGLGKSELVQRVAVALRQASRFHVVRATDLDRGVVRAMRAAVEHTLRTTGRSRLAVERAVSALVRRTGPDDDDESAGALTELLRPSGLASGANRHQRNLATLSRFLRRLAREHPVLLVLEDAHEGGEDVGALLRHLLFDLWSDPYLLLCVITQRVEPKRGESPVSKTLRHLEATRPQALCRIDLRPLEDDVMLAGVGREYELDDARRHAVVAAAAGNPAFARMLAGMDELPEDTTVGPTDQALPRQLRATLAAMLEERLERVTNPRALRDLLRHLAILGGQASAELLAAFVAPTDGASDASTIADEIDTLIELQLVLEPAVDELRLAHPTMREVLLEGVAPRRLRRLHLRAAALRQRSHGDVGAVGDHLFAAGRAAEAVPQWIRAEKVAFHFGDCRQAAQWGRKALSQISVESPEHFEASELLARTLREMTAYEPAVEVLEPLVEGAGSPLERFRAAELLGEVLQEQGDDDAWAKTVARIEENLPTEPGPARRAGLRALAFWANHRLDVVGAQRFAEEALVGDDLEVDERATACKRLFWACFYQVDFERADHVARRLLALAEDTGRSDLEAEGWRLVGKIHQETPEFDDAIIAFERALQLYRRLGRQSRVINSYLDIMFVACTAERYDEALNYVERFERVRPTRVLDYTGVLVRLTELRCRALGRSEPVCDALGELDEHVSRSSFGFRAVVRGEWVSALVREGREDQARPMLDDLYREVGELPPLVWNATHLEHLATALRERDDAWTHSAANVALDLAATIYRRLGNVERATRAHAAAREVDDEG